MNTKQCNSCVKFLCASILGLLCLVGAAPSHAQSWPPTKVSFVANPNPDNLGTTGGVFNSLYDIRWFTTIKHSDGYTGGATAPTFSLDATETISWNLTSTIGDPASNAVPDLEWIHQKNRAIEFPSIYPWVSSNSLALDVAVPYTRSGVDTSGLTRYLRTLVDDISMVGQVDGTGVTDTDPVDFVYKVSGPAGDVVTVYIAQGYYNSTYGDLSSGSITVKTLNPVASWNHTYSTTTSEGNTTVTNANSDLTVSFTIPSGGIWYFVVPAYANSHVIMSSSCVGDGPIGMRWLEGSVDTRYEVDVYKVTSP